MLIKTPTYYEYIYYNACLGFNVRATPSGAAMRGNSTLESWQVVCSGNEYGAPVEAQDGESLLMVPEQRKLLLSHLHWAAAIL